MTEKHKIYCFNDGGSPGLMAAVALADDGVVLAMHVCSNESFMRHDLGMDESTRKHEAYDAHFGKGNWELEWVGEQETHKGFLEALKKNLEQKFKSAEADRG